MFVFFTSFKNENLKKFFLIMILLFGYLTDIFDGIIARTRNQVTTFGIFADPIADKFLIATVLILLVYIKSINPLVAIILIGRDIVMTGFRAFAASEKIIIPSLITGKIKMLFESILVLYYLSGLGIIIIEVMLLFGSIFFSLLSMILCLLKYKKILKFK